MDLITVMSENSQSTSFDTTWVDVERDVGNKWSEKTSFVLYCIPTYSLLAFLYYSQGKSLVQYQLAMFHFLSLILSGW